MTGVGAVVVVDEGDERMAVDCCDWNDGGGICG